MIEVSAFLTFLKKAPFKIIISFVLGTLLYVFKDKMNILSKICTSLKFSYSLIFFTFFIYCLLEVCLFVFKKIFSWREKIQNERLSLKKKEIEKQKKRNIFLSILNRIASSEEDIAFINFLRKLEVDPANKNHRLYRQKNESENLGPHIQFKIHSLLSQYHLIGYPNLMDIKSFNNNKLWEIRLHPDFCEAIDYFFAKK